MEPFPSPCGAVEPGIAALVERARENQTPAMTLEEVQRVGALDPVAYEIDVESHAGKPVQYSLDEEKDGPKIAEIVESLKVLGIHTHTHTHTHTRTHTHTHTYLFTPTIG